MNPAISIKQRRLKYVATINNESLTEATEPDYELQYIDIGNVDSYGTVHDVVTYKFEDAPSRARGIARHGDVIVSTVRTYLQAITPIENPPENLIVSTDFAVVRPNGNLFDARFCKYAVREKHFLWEVESRSTGVSYPAINASDLADIRINLPDVETQRLIADYLDRETVRIDALVAEKEKMLALLKEKRAALISSKVTRGLDESAPLKPSGLDWLGDIPAHWETRTLKKVSLRIDTGSTPSASYMDGTLQPEFLWFTPGDFENGGELIDSKRKIPLEAIEDKEAKVFPANAIMVIGIGATLGKVATSPVEFSANQQINVIYPSKETFSEFLLYVLQGYEKVFRTNANSSTLPILNQERLGAIHIPFPPMEEQLLIAAKIREKKAAERKILEQLISSIELLKERRAALITAAVTGQIPVEEMSP